MADFCAQCSIEKLGLDFGDCADQCAEGSVTTVVCEGCGPTRVDCLGICQGDCGKHDKSAASQDSEESRP